MSIPKISMKKKVYVFYLTRDKGGREIPMRIYAYTQDKTIRNFFRTIRNMEYFIEKKYDTFTDFLASERGLKENCGRYLLTYRPILTKNDFGNRSEIEVLMTWSEEQEVVLYMDKEIERLRKKVYFPLDVMFKKPYRKALNILCYNDFSIWIRMRNSKHQISNDIYEDQFRIFMLLFGYTMGL